MPTHGTIKNQHYLSINRVHGSTVKALQAMYLLLCMLFLVPSLAGAAQAPNRILELDGDGDYVELPSHIFADLDEATVEGWVRWDHLGFFPQFFGFGSGRAWQAIGLNNYHSTPTISFFIYNAQHQLHVVQVQDFLQTGRWYHFAAVTGPGGMKLYANGVLIGENGYEGSFASVGNSQENYLGRPQWEENEYFQGALDEVRVWSVARTAAQIRTFMHERLTGTEEGLVALWDFDAGDARDLSPSGHHGQLRGDARVVEAELPPPVSWTSRP